MILFLISGLCNVLCEDEEKVVTPPSLPKGTISGKVIHHISNEGIASVTVVCKPREVAGWPREIEFQTVTDSAGRYSFQNLKSGMYVIYPDPSPEEFIIASFQPYWNSIVPRDLFAKYPRVDDNEITEDFHLNPVWKVKGRVFQPTGDPLPRARIHLNFVPLGVQPNIDRSGFVGQISLFHSVLTNDMGEYEILSAVLNYPTASYVMAMASHAAYGRQQYYFSKPFSPEPGQHLEGIDISFRHYPNLKGRVMDRQANHGVPEAEVVVYSKQVMGNHTYFRIINIAQSDENGRFSMYVSPGAYGCFSAKEGFQDNDITRQVFISIDDERDVTIDMDPGDSNSPLLWMRAWSY